PITTSSSTVPTALSRTTDSYTNDKPPSTTIKIQITGARRLPKNRSVAQPARYDPAAAPIAITKNCKPALPIGRLVVSIKCVSPQSTYPYRQAFSSANANPSSHSVGL